MNKSVDVPIVVLEDPSGTSEEVQDSQKMRPKRVLFVVALLLIVLIGAVSAYSVIRRVRTHPLAISGCSNVRVEVDETLECDNGVKVAITGITSKNKNYSCPSDTLGSLSSGMCAKPDDNVWWVLTVDGYEYGGSSAGDESDSLDARIFNGSLRGGGYAVVVHSSNYKTYARLSVIVDESYFWVGLGQEFELSRGQIARLEDTGEDIICAVYPYFETDPYSETADSEVKLYINNERVYDDYNDSDYKILLVYTQSGQRPRAVFARREIGSITVGESFVAREGDEVSFGEEPEILFKLRGVGGECREICYGFRVENTWYDDSITNSEQNDTYKNIIHRFPYGVVVSSIDEGDDSATLTIKERDLPEVILAEKYTLRVDVPAKFGEGYLYIYENHDSLSNLSYIMPLSDRPAGSMAEYMVDVGKVYELNGHNIEIVGTDRRTYVEIVVDAVR